MSDSDIAASQIAQARLLSDVVSALAARMSALTPTMAARRPRAALSLDMSHVSQRNEEGSWWSCGYRNIQMLCSALMRDSAIAPLLFGGSGVLPDVTSLQMWLERAWARGFDPAGAAQLGGQGSLYQSTKWIGSTEAAALLRSSGVPARVVALHSFDSPVIEQALGAEAAARARTARAVAEADLLCDTGRTPDMILRPWAYDTQGRPKAKAKDKAGGKAAAGASAASAGAGAGSSTAAPAAGSHPSA